MNATLPTIALALALGMVSQPAIAGPIQRADELVGTWECAPANMPKNLRFLKHVTPTHFQWVIYDKDKQTAVATVGGTWSRDGDTYKEKIDYILGDGLDQLKGQEFAFSVRLEGDRWFHKAKPGTNLDVDEVWTRVKKAE